MTNSHRRGKSWAGQSKSRDKTSKGSHKRRLYFRWLNASADWSLCSANFHAHPQAVLDRIGPKVFL